MADALQLKTTYKPKAKLEAFYTGAAARLTRDGKHAVCACGDEVKVRRSVRHLFMKPERRPCAQ
jgi:hypothetical protein